MTKSEAMKAFFVKVNFADDEQIVADTVAGVLADLAVAGGVVDKREDLPDFTIVGILTYITDNIDKVHHLSVTATKCTVTVTRGDEELEDGAVIRDGDKLIVTAEADEGYEMSVLTADGETITSGDEITVEADVTIVGTATEE